MSSLAVKFAIRSSKSQVEGKKLIITNVCFIEKRSKYSKNIQSLLEIKDQQIILPFENIINIGRFHQQGCTFIQSKEYQLLLDNVLDYVSEVCENINSIAYKHLLSDELSSSETKEFASKNILSNIREKLSGSELVTDDECQDLIELLTKNIDDHLKKLLVRLASKYPQAPQQGVNPIMNKLIPSVDRSANEENDFILANGISIEKYAKSTNFDEYSPFIMEVVNKVIQISGQIPNDSNQTYFDQFQTFIQSLFYFGQREDSKDIIKMILEKDRQLMNVDEQQVYSDFLIYFSKKLSPNRNNREICSQYFMKVVKQQEQAILQARNYQKKNILRKIPSHVRSFNNVQLKSTNFKVRHSSILRIMTKWMESLQRIFQKPQEFIRQRIYPLKSITGKVSRVEENVKILLLKQITCQSKIVKDQLALLIKENNFLQSYFLGFKDLGGSTLIKRFTQVRGIAAEMTIVLTSFTIKYLCILIHHLVKAGKVTIKYSNGIEEFQYDLVSFKIGDLFRCKLQCDEAKLFNILNIIQILDEEATFIKDYYTGKNIECLNGIQELKGKFQLVRIKNKLNKSDNNLLINFMFLQKVQCELQLSAQDISKKDKNSYEFSHFLYELTRGKFGVLTEYATIICQNDDIIKASKDSYYIPQIRRGKHQERKIFHRVNKKNEDSYVCIQCGQLRFLEQAELFVPEELACNKCVSAGADVEQKLKKVQPQMIEFIVKGLQTKKLRRVRNYKQIQCHNYILSINNMRKGDKVKFYRVWKHQRQLKIFLVELSMHLFKKFQPFSQDEEMCAKQFDFNLFNYFDIKDKMKQQVQMDELTYIVDSHIRKKIFNLLKMEVEKELQQALFDQFESFRIEKMLIKNIIKKPEVIDFRGDQKQLWIFDQIASTLGKKYSERLRYKNYGPLQTFIKKLDWQQMQLEQIPTSLDHIETNLLDLGYNNIKQVSLPHQSKMLFLSIYQNECQKIDLRYNVNLIHICCWSNWLTTIDLTYNTKITRLLINGNRIQSAIFWYSNQFVLDQTLYLVPQDSETCKFTILCYKKDFEKCNKLKKQIEDSCMNEKCNYFITIQERN